MNALSWYVLGELHTLGRVTLIGLAKESYLEPFLLHRTLHKLQRIGLAECGNGYEWGLTDIGWSALLVHQRNKIRAGL